jgi:RNA polymerase sigma-70 factor (ECF subfamily)
MSENKPEISIEALKSGNRDEYSKLVESYSGMIYRLALKMVGNPTDAEDVLQNTFLKAFQHIGEFEGRSNLSTWLYRIGANEALMMIRKHHPEMVLGEVGLDEAEQGDLFPAQFTDWCCLPEDEFLTSESKAALEQAIQHLPETLRIVFLLRDIEGLSIEETGNTLGLSETNVKTRLLRARLRLREELSDYYSERLKERRQD